MPPDHQYASNWVVSLFIESFRLDIYCETLNKFRSKFTQADAVATATYSQVGASEPRRTPNTPALATV